MIALTNKYLFASRMTALGRHKYRTQELLYLLKCNILPYGNKKIEFCLAIKLLSNVDSLSSSRTILTVV